MVNPSPTPDFSLIVAMAQNGAIGKNNDLLWHISDDLKRFKSLTSGHTVIMGRRTFDSLPKKPLPKRRNIVLTTDTEFHYDGVEVAHSLPALFDMVRFDESPFIMGGANLYKQLLPFSNRLYVTMVYRDFDADVFFPTIDRSVFREVSASPRFTDETSGLDYSYIDYVRIPNK